MKEKKILSQWKMPYKTLEKKTLSIGPQINLWATHEGEYQNIYPISTGILSKDQYM